VDETIDFLKKELVVSKKKEELKSKLEEREKKDVGIGTVEQKSTKVVEPRQFVFQKKLPTRSRDSSAIKPHKNFVDS